MLDLNVASEGEEPKLLEEASSGGGEVFAFSFGILGRSSPSSGDDGCGGDVNPQAEVPLVTRHLFPESAVVDGGTLPVMRLSPLPLLPEAVAVGHWGSVGFGEVAEAGGGTKIKATQLHQQVKKSRRGPRSRSSQYRGVTFYRRTGRWESHIWDCGKQVYLGGFDTAHAAARAYDRAAIKFRGVDADINFNLNDYDEDLKQMINLSKEEFIHILRRQSTGFSRGSSKYRGVTLHKCGRWEARMGQLLGKKAYDKAAIKCNGREAVTNFEPSTYEGEIISEADHEAADLDLDLSLTISLPPANSPKSGGNSLGFHLQHRAVEVPDARICRVWRLISAAGGLRASFSTLESLWRAGKRLRSPADRSARAKVSQILIPAVAWSIWLIRNQVVFRGSTPYTENIWEYVIRLVSDWGVFCVGASSVRLMDGVFVVRE